ncbi:hypothetical protein [Haloterrigena sp. H1]|uniref:hypothetical protein n=1 Tax=Haloterrigena sp. H1 TaxID=2552943 RepID=UPI001BB102DC|nr:hypothetical protein [Haloterrigena sp. H1]
MILSVAAPLGTVSAAAAANTDVSPDETDELNVSVDDTVVTVTWNESAFENETTKNGTVEGAAVNVTSLDENVSYAANGTTDTNGTLDLSAPETTVNVTVNASSGNASGTTVAMLEPTTETESEGLDISVEQNNDDVTVTVTENDTAAPNATVNVSTVDENVSYTDEGTYTTDENGTVSLSAPSGTTASRSPSPRRPTANPLRRR